LVNAKLDDLYFESLGIEQKKLAGVLEAWY